MTSSLSSLTGADASFGFYHRYPSSGRSPDLVLAIERIEDFATGRPRGPDYPGFQRALVAPQAVSLSRFDAEGTLHLPAPNDDPDDDPNDDPDDGRSNGPNGGEPPVRGSFRVGESQNSAEAVIRIGMSVALPRIGGFIMHASAIEVEGGAHIFAGVSGAGKSTIAAMLEESWPACRKLSDELLIVAPDDSGHMAVFVSPFIGSTGLPHGRSVPVRALYFLHQAPEHRREPMARGTGLRELLRHVLVYVAEADTAARVLDAASNLLSDITCHRLQFAKDPGVASVLALT